jgi:ParB family chromosome partitioning protein
MAKRFNMSDILRGESVTSDKATESAQSFVIKQIPLAHIRRSENNKYGIRDIEELAATIEAVGLMHNILVRETADPEVYELISGERRYMAFKFLWEAGDEKYATIPCKVEPQINDDLSELRLLLANSTARELNDFEKTHQAIRIREILKNLKEKGYKIKGRINEIIADVMDVSAAQVGRMTKIHANLTPGFMAEFEKGEIGITAAYDIAILPQEEQAKVLEEYKEVGPEAIRKVTVKQNQPTVPDEKGSDENDALPNEQDDAATNEQKEEPKHHTVENEKRTDDPARANKVQRALVIAFGKEAVRDLFMAEGDEQRTRITGVIEAFTAVAGAFGIHDYDKEIHSITEYADNQVGLT